MWEAVLKCVKLRPFVGSGPAGKRKEGGFNSSSSQKSLNHRESLHCKLCSLGLWQNVLENVIKIVSFLHSCVCLPGWKTLVRQTHWNTYSAPRDAKVLDPCDSLHFFFFFLKQSEHREHEALWEKFGEDIFVFVPGHVDFQTQSGGEDGADDIQRLVSHRWDAPAQNDPVFQRIEELFSRNRVRVSKVISTFGWIGAILAGLGVIFWGPAAGTFWMSKLIPRICEPECVALRPIFRWWQF